MRCASLFSLSIDSDRTEVLVELRLRALPADRFRHAGQRQ